MAGPSLIQQSVGQYPRGVGIDKGWSQKHQMVEQLAGKVLLGYPLARAPDIPVALQFVDQ
ncbi:hypothetical protein D9M71_806240 [compost metagenome]